jgi:hypothetical protein
MIFPVASVSRPALRLTQSLIQWVLEVLSQGVKRGRGVTLTTHPHLVPRSRINRSTTLPLSLDASMSVARQVYFFTFTLYHLHNRWYASRSDHIIPEVPKNPQSQLNSKMGTLQNKPGCGGEENILACVEN